MTINGESLEKYGARQWNISMSYPDITNNSQWILGSLNPLMVNSSAGLKQIKVTLLLNGTNRQQMWTNGGELIAKLMEPSIITLDGFEHNFFVVLVNPKQDESVIKRFHLLTLDMVGYEYADEVTAESIYGGGININYDGNIDCPAIIEITPAYGLVSMVIKKIYGNPTKTDIITINKLTQRRVIVIDGETGLALEDGVNKFQDIELLEFPNISPGLNQFSWSQSQTDVTIKYKPRFL
jgi:hypothetical protein